MKLPWEKLGLQRFLVLDEGKAFLCEEGSLNSNAPEEDYPRVAYGYSGVDTIDLQVLARIILPTLPDHSLDGLCRHFSIRRERGVRIAGLFAALVEEALSLSPEHLAGLGRLLPDRSGELLLRLAPLAKKASPVHLHPRARPSVPRVTVEEALSRDGVIGRRLTAFEDRPGQLEMARLVARTFSAGGTLVVEAGPGTGKTFAYLVPALIHLRDHPQERVVVSTRTKQLQEQLYLKDIPFLTAQLAPSVRTALLKGRENYLCLRQWQTVFPEVTAGLDRELLPTLGFLAGWLFRTETGDIEENHAFLAAPNWRKLWPRLSDSPHRCLGPVCPFYDECFSVAARRRAREAELVVVNHSLLFADLETDGSILGDYDYLIVDEAHALEGAARSAFTATLAPGTLERLLGEIQHGRGRREGGWIIRISLPADDSRLKLVRELIGSLGAANLRLFSRLAKELPPDPRGFIPPLTGFASQVERISLLLSRLKGAIEGVKEALEEAAPVESRVAERLSETIDSILTSYRTLFSPPQDGYVNWYERRAGNEVLLHSSPLEVQPILSESLYPRVKGLVITSATLSSGGGFEYLNRTLGLDASPGETHYAVVDSPFSYTDRMRIFLPGFLPPVDEDADAYASGIAGLIEAISVLHRKVLVLFTSYRLLNAVYSRLDGKALAQGVDGPRGKLLEHFKKSAGGAILLGTDSFWEGVDLPGKELEILIITRLPFPVPTDPVFSGLSKRMADAGRDPFYELGVPQAVLKLRQGVGRLIRTQSDRGTVIITDRRILERGYGRRFLASLPVTPEAVSTEAELLDELENWFSSQG